MRYPQEDMANNLYHSLIEKFESSATQVSLNGVGVHWHCIAENDSSNCKINCFASNEPEYYTSFSRQSNELASSRIASKDDTIAAVQDWLTGYELSTIYERYHFVDQKKRALVAIRDGAFMYAPELQTTSDLRGFGDFYALHFRTKERSCKISFYGKNDLPDAKFSWDDCQLFTYQPENQEQLASVLKQWVCNFAMPSQMRKEFPWLVIGELADYYESGNPVEGEFVQSWNSIEEFYQSDYFNTETSNSALYMIQEMRQAGYDRLLRAGQSLSFLGLSRSRRHGLRREQPCLWFTFGGSEMDVTTNFGMQGLAKHPVELTESVKNLLDTLVEHEVD